MGFMESEGPMDIPTLPKGNRQEIACRGIGFNDIVEVSNLFSIPICFSA